MSFLGEFEAARGALEEFLPEFLFKVRNLARERRLRDGELLRGGGEALFPSDFDERTKYLEIHGVAWVTVRVVTSPPADGRHRHHSATIPTSCHAVKRRSWALKTRATRRSFFPWGVSPYRRLRICATASAIIFSTCYVSLTNFSLNTQWRSPPQLPGRFARGHCALRSAEPFPPSARSV